MKLTSLLQKFKAFQTRMESETDLLGQELQKFIVQLNFDLSQKSKIPSNLDLNSFKDRFTDMNNLISLLVKQLEQ